MSTAPEIPYTDRNVREDPTLTNYAIGYLNAYGGEFEPLVNAQEMLRETGQLPTSIIRVVLNCMRHDTNVAALMPVPNAQINGARRARDTAVELTCMKTEPHYMHWLTPKKKCNGVPWPINRSPYQMPATVKKPFVRSRTGKMIHYVNNEPGASYVTWYPRYHEYGFQIESDLSIRIICKYPGIIKNGILLDEMPPPDILEMMVLEECHWCVDAVTTPAELKA